MTRGAVRRFGIAGVVALVVAASGCTIGDDSTEVIVDDGGDATTVLTEAMASLQQGSGRFRQAVTLAEESASSGESVGVIQLEGSFDGADVEVTSTLDMGAEADEAAPMITRQRTIGDVQYLSLEGEPLPGWEEGTWVATELDDTTDSFDWMFGTTNLLSRHGAEVVGSVEGLAERPPAELDGVTYRAFGGSVGIEAATALLWDGTALEEIEDETEGMPEAARDRYDRIRAYEAEHTSIELEVLVGEDGSLRRLVLEGTSEVEDRYADCMELGSSGDFRLEFEVFDRGAPVVIEAPDPASVRSAEDMVDVGVGGSEEERAAVRPMFEEEVRAGADLIGLDPASIPSMSHDELLDALDRIDVAIDALPTTDTVMGPLSRPELLEMVKLGMEIENVDPSIADSLTDEQLGELIDAYRSAESAGPDAQPSEEELSEELYFEGCPA